MATSGSVDFNLTRDEIIKDALVTIGAFEQSDTPPAADVQFAARQLNRMVKAWQANGAQLWVRREAFLFPVKSQARYKIGPNSTEHTAELGDAVNTLLASAGASGDGTISVDSATGMATSDNIGIVLDDDTIQWTTISSISSTTITLGASLTGAAAEDNAVFAYTNTVDRPLRVLDAQRVDKDDRSTPIATISHREYQRLPNKTDTGKTNELYYQPERPDGFIYLWPEPETAADRIQFTAMFPFEDFDASSNNPDFPQEWLDALVWGLAARLCVSYGVERGAYREIAAQAAMLYNDVWTFDEEPESVYIQPNLTSHFD